ncbi:hypothetical protein ACHAWU_009918 [Discostella pseudostelligera]|uniref:Uncharacterized protein n=1 Tax=Discostella pseudostelligera TaxID=259834 RepID=A0ABD3M1B8_9STRA
MTDSVATAAPNGGGVKKKRNRKRGGGGGGGGGAGGGPKSGSNINTAKDASGRGGGSGNGGGVSAATGTATTSSAKGRGSGSRGNATARRGGMGGGRGSGGGGVGGGNVSSRFKPNAPSPLQLPFVKVTIRNIGDGSKHSSIERIVTSVRKFLEGAFPSSTTTMQTTTSTAGVGSGSSGSNEISPYMMACQLEREEFEADKTMVSEATAENRAAGGATLASHIFSSGYVNDDKSRVSVLPAPDDIVNNLMNNTTDKKVTAGSSIGWIVDTAMSQMMQECGKHYLNYVGGRIVLDEESFVEVCLAEKVQAERKRLALESKSSELADRSNTADAADASDSAEKQPDNVGTERSSVEDVTNGIAKMSTADKQHEVVPKVDEQSLIQSPSVRVRIMSITPVKKSKRRGEIGGKVQLVIYPPDPCILFKEKCRDAGKMAADQHLSKVNAAKEQVVDGTETGVTNGNEHDVIASSEGKDDAIKSDDQPSTSQDGPSSSKRMITPTPQIPYYPIMSSMERSRALARSRILMNRTIKAMELHAAGGKDLSHAQWEVVESSSQKTWKERPHYFVRATMDGKPLSELVAEHDTAPNITAKKGRGRGGIDARADRLESTIESSDDYKAFLASLENGPNPTTSSGNDATGKKGADSKSMTTSSEKHDIPAVDGEGRPLAAIVLHLRGKQEAEKAKVEKAKADIAAAQAKARAAAAAAKEKARQEKERLRKEAAKKQRDEVARKKSRASSSRTGGSSGIERNKKGGMPMPPPGATLLKKVGGSAPIPPSGFG